MKRNMRTGLKVLIITLMGIMSQLLLLCAANADPVTIRLSASDTYYQPLVRHLVHAQDDDLKLGLDDVLSGALEFSSVQTPYADFDLGPARHWLWARLHNETAQDGTWRVDMRRQYMHELTLYAVRSDGRAEILIDHTDQNNFDDRPINSRFLQANLAIARDEVVDIYIAYRSTSVSFLPPAVGTIDGVAKSHLQEFTIDALFNGGLAAMFVLTLLFMPIVGWKLSLSFCAYITAGAMFVLHADSYSFQYFWPNSPQLNDAANLGFMLLMPVFGLSFARVLFRTRELYPIWDKVILSYVLIAASMSVLSLTYVHIPLLMTLAYSFVPVGTLIQLFTGISMRYRGLVGATPYLLGAIGVTIAFAHATIAHLQPGYWSLDRTLDVGHASILLECFAFASAIVLRMVSIRTERDTALRKELVEAQRRLNAERDLRKSQADFAFANKLSEDRLNQLASVSHDLQAPLKTLRRVVGQIGQSSEAGTERMHATLDYLEDLARQELTKSTPMISDQKAGTRERFAATIIMNNIAELFADRARAENIEFRQRVSDLMITADPVSLMRVVSNLVSNAIEHAQAGKVLVSCRRRGGHATLQVWDNGVGIPINDRNLIFKRGKKGPMSSGSGMGLAIVADECAAEGIAFDVCSKQGRGTCITLTLPMNERAAE